MALTQFEHGLPHGRRLRLPLLKPRVKGDHEILGALVMYVPQSKNK